MTLSLLVYLPKSLRLRQSLSKLKCLVMMLKGPVNVCASEPVTSGRERWVVLRERHWVVWHGNFI